MVDRRTFTAGVAALLTAPPASWSQLPHRKTFFYASVGPTLTVYDVNVKDATLARRDSIDLPRNVQYAWPHPTANVLYVVSSDGGPGMTGEAHRASALRINVLTGELSSLGPVLPLRARPVHASVDKTGNYLLIAHNNPSGVTVLRIRADRTIGEAIPQPADLDVGIFAHQIRAMPSNTAVALVTRGNDPMGSKPEDPGAIKIFGFKNGVLSNRASIAPGNGYGFGPRHLDFHPHEPWAYVSLERQNKLQLYKLANDSLDAQPLFTKDTLAEPGNVRRPQLAGTVHVHPNGRYVYVANRSDAMIDFNGARVDAGGENNIAVFAIDAASGEPTLIQNVATHGFHPRTFALHPGIWMLVAANTTARLVREGSSTRIQPATLTTYHAGRDGKLSFANSYDIATDGGAQFWSGMVPAI